MWKCALYLVKKYDILLNIAHCQLKISLLLHRRDACRTQYCLSTELKSVFELSFIETDILIVRVDTVYILVTSPCLCHNVSYVSKSCIECHSDKDCSWRRIETNIAHVASL